MEISRGVTLTVRFLCELAMLAALAFWGFGAGDGLGAWLPKARFPVPAPVRVAIDLVLFAAAAGALAAAAQSAAGMVLAVAGGATSLLNEVQERRAGPETIRRR